MAGFDAADAALAWCEEERDNLVGAVGWAARCGEADTAWRLPLVLGSFFNLRKYWADWIAAHETGLAAARACGDRSAQGWLLTSLGTAYRDTGRTGEAVAAYE